MPGNVVKSCAFCGLAFKAATARAVYCSAKCRLTRWKRANPAKARITYPSTESSTERSRRWRKKNPQYQREWWQRHPDKIKARQAVCLALKAGKLVRHPCQGCGSQKSEAHHPNYAQPLEVQWLCRPCHAAEHKRSLNSWGNKNSSVVL